MRYLGKTVWPSKLALYYPHSRNSLHWWQVAGAFLLLLAITIWTSRARRHRYLIVGWLWFLITLVPMIGLIQVDVQGLADRYAYVSFIGLFLMICWGVSDWAAERHLPPAAMPTVAAVVLLAAAVVSYRQIGYWSDNVLLWSHSVEVTTGNWKAEYMLGASLEAEGQRDVAIPHYMRAAAIFPSDPFTDLSIANYEHQHGNYPLAIEYYKKALPGAWNLEQRAQTLNSMAASYRLLGDNASADQCLERIKTLPSRRVNWQGSWWQQIMPIIREHLHRGASKPQS